MMAHQDLRLGRTVVVTESKLRAAAARLDIYRVDGCSWKARVGASHEEKCERSLASVQRTDEKGRLARCACATACAVKERGSVHWKKPENGLLGDQPQGSAKVLHD
ncbi:hypothetical protein PC119_g23069 [Phytophthora cactorum]|nr:hypothetical protein PC119_g23069 [Phytophthora cactorum]